MGALTNVFQSMTRKHVPESGNTAIATRTLDISAKSLAIVAKGNVQGARSLSFAQALVTKPRVTQAAMGAIAQKAGHVEEWARDMAIMKPIVDKMTASYVKGAKDQIDISKKLAKAGQTVAVLNSEAQSEISFAHRQASAQTTYAQAAYGGQGWSA